MRKVQHIMIKQLLLSVSLVAVTTLGSALPAHAQDSATTTTTTAPAAAGTSSGGMDEIENLFSKEEETPSDSPVTSTTTTPAAPGTETPKPEASDVSKTKVKGVTDLGKLQPFKDVAVIQKRFLPKSQRFEFFIAPALMLNDAFFNDFGATARLGYYLSERYGVEGVYTYLTTSARKVTNDLGTQHVQTTSFVTPQGYYGIDFKWDPIYGKMSWQNRKITPFDLYFNFGVGLTPTNQNSSPATLHLGTGQVFAFSKSGALRWNFDWFMYSSTSTATGGTSSALYHNLLISIGWSFFFPEATYR